MEVCFTCQKPKAALSCALCQTSLCKGCAQFLEEDSFQFALRVPDDCKHGVYCTVCYDDKVVPELFRYNEVLDQAKEILVFTKSQSKETRLIKRKEATVVVKDCADHDETIMRLAFSAALSKYNAIVDVDLVSKKIRSGTYQTTVWDGTAIPVMVDVTKVIGDRPILRNPN